MDKEKVIKSLEKIEKGLEKYNLIMETVHKVNVSENDAFQRMFNGFYRMRQRPKEFYIEFYKYLEDKKNSIIKYDDVLMHFYNKFNRIEASFASKLLATIDPNMPVWDEFVLKNLNLKRPQSYDKARLEKTIDLYNQITKWYQDFLQTDKAKEMLQLFDEKYPNSNLTEVKKIDLILWQMRD